MAINRFNKRTMLRNLHRESFFDKKGMSGRLGLERLFFTPHVIHNRFYTNITGCNFRDLAWDGTYLYASASGFPGSVFKINPETGAFSSLTLPAGHNGTSGLVYDGEWLWVSSPAGATYYVDKIDTQTMTVLASIVIAEGGCNCGCFDGRNVFFVTYTSPGVVIKIDRVAETYTTHTLAAGNDLPRIIRYDGEYLFLVTNTRPAIVVRINPDFTGETSLSLGATPFGGNTGFAFDIISDGNNVFTITDCEGTTKPATICKVNIEAMSIIKKSALPLADFAPWAVTPYYFTFDGKYIYCAIHAPTPSYLLRFNPDDLSWDYFVFPTHYNTARVVLYNGRRVWTGFSTTPGRLVGLVFGPKATIFDAGVTDTFAIDGVGLIQTAVTFNHPFDRTPFVMVWLQDLSATDPEFDFVDVTNITSTGCTLRADIRTASATPGATGKFGWLAINKEMYMI